MASTIAKCYLKDKNDEGNICLLTEESLHIKYKSRESIFFNHWITEISFKHKKFLIPIVFGGISASFSAVGLFQYYLNPWLMLTLFFSSIMFIYYGLHGSMALVVKTPIKEYDFFINNITDNLKAFSAFASTAIKGDEIVFYFLVKKSDLVEIQTSGYLQPNSDGLKLSTNKPEPSKGQVLCCFESKKLPFEVKYINSKNGRLEPFVFDKIPLSVLSIVDHSN